MAAEIGSPLSKRQTAPVTPTSQKKGGNFFTRHLGRRRRSSVTLPNGHPISSPAPQHNSPHTPKSAVRKASVSSSNHDGKESMEKANGGHGPRDSHENKSVEEVELPPMVQLPEMSSSSEGSNGELEGSQEQANGHVNDEKHLSPPQSPRQGSRSVGVTWAEGYNDSTAPVRVRRTSSAGTAGTGSARRSSIYVRGTDGHHVEGVDAGVGSKARKLSVHIPSQLQTDECPLASHFSVFARAGKKDIGEGGAAVVRLMQSKTAGSGKDKVFAVKEFREWDSEEEDEDDYVRKIKSEYAIAKSCQHPNIVETFRLCTADHDKKWFHVMQYCELGDLNDLINSNYFSGEDRNCMFKQLLRGVEYLHKCGIAHRDLKSENLLVTKDGCLKIADFGTAEVFCGTHPGLRGCRRPSIIDEEAPIRKCKPGLVGSRPYMAPEIIEHKYDYDPRAVDIWSCGIVYLSLWVGGTPWECASTDVKNYNIYCNSWDKYYSQYPDGIMQKGRLLPDFAKSAQWRALGDMETRVMVFGMLHPDPSKRWSAKEALETKTVTEYPCCQQEGYSDDIRTRQRKALHNHVPPKNKKKPGQK
jgi:protein-serine/threonine kinase